MDTERASSDRARPDSAAKEQSRSRSRSHSQSRSESASEQPQSPGYSKRQRIDGLPTTSTFVTKPPLDYGAPPLPDEAPPEDDGWSALWDDNAKNYYFYNRFTQISQWENPRVPEGSANLYGSYDRSTINAAPGTSNTAGAPGTIGSSNSSAPATSSPPKRPAGGYNPAIHGSYDPNADYAVEARKQEEEEEAAATSAAALAAGLPDPNQDYTSTGHFNRFSGGFQNPGINPDNHNDDAKSRRQMNAFFDVDAAANSHDGRSLKAERRNKTLTKRELQQYKDKRHKKKEEKRRAWLKD